MCSFDRATEREDMALSLQTVDTGVELTQRLLDIVNTYRETIEEMMHNPDGLDMEDITYLEKELHRLNLVRRVALRGHETL